MAKFPYIPLGTRYVVTAGDILSKQVVENNRCSFWGNWVSWYTSLFNGAAIKTALAQERLQTCSHQPNSLLIHLANEPWGSSHADFRC